MKPTLNKAEVDILRSQTRGCADVIHFNNAGASLPPDIVVDTVVDYLREEALRGGYETEARYSVQINEVYNSIARMINADKGEIAIFENASAAWITAFRGLSSELQQLYGNIDIYLLDQLLKDTYDDCEKYTERLKGRLHEPKKTTNVQNLRCMTTSCLQKNKDYHDYAHSY